MWRQIMFLHLVLVTNFLITLDPGGSVNQIPGECTIAGDVR